MDLAAAPDKEYDKVLEMIDKLEEVLSTYGLEVGCVAGTYSPIDIQVHITEVQNDISE